MATSSRHTYPRRALIALLVLFIALSGLLLGAHQWGKASLAPKLGLDLEGGTQMILQPKLVGAETVNQEQIAQARDIIVQRVDANGVSGAEVTTQGEANIVVSIPDTPDRATKDAIQQSSQMQFRPVLAEGAGTPQPAPTASPTGSASGSPSASPAASPSRAKASASPGGSASPTAKSVVPQALRAASSPTPTPTPSTGASSSPRPSSSASATTTGAAKTPTDPTDMAWVTPQVQAAYEALNCNTKGALDTLVDDRTKPLVTCSSDGQAKYILGPVVVGGDQIKDASAGYQTLQNGSVSSTVEIQLSLKDAGSKAYAEISKKMVALQQPQNQLASTLDSKVIVAPAFREAILNGQASITGGFTIEEARSLAQQLKFGALPISFTVQTESDISPTLGKEQLTYGLLAGLIGLALVIGYSLMQYRALGLVTVSSVVIAALLTYLAITILGWSHNYRLDMAGVTGLIVAIGFTADSFIVYFERIRDELRDGRSLASAVETGWNRAKRTILAADGVNFIAALVLYILASSSVRGFAFTLGLTTILDLLIVFWFTHPLVALLARRPFFRDGHPWSGLDPRRLAAKTTRYAGRGRFAAAPGTARLASSDGSAR